MKNENKRLYDEIQEMREKVHNCIEQNGINDEAYLIEINHRLDELILKWIKNSNK